MPYIQDFPVPQGATLDVEFVITPPGDVTLAGARVLWAAWGQSFGVPLTADPFGTPLDPVIIKDSHLGDIDILESPESFTLHLLDADTALLPLGNYFHEAHVTDANGNDTPVTQGTMTVTLALIQGSGGVPPSSGSPQFRSTVAWRYAPNGNFSGNTYLPGAYGFNLADVSSPSGLGILSGGVKALVYLGYTAGNDATFQALVASFTGAAGAANIFAWYLADNVADGLQANLMAEADYLHSLTPAIPVYLEQQNIGPNDGPFIFPNNPANTHCDLFGIAAYPIQTNLPGNIDMTIIPRSVAAAVEQGIPLSKIIPEYQAFGGGTITYPSYILPTPEQEWEILGLWRTAFGSVIPVFEVAYSFDQQGDDVPLNPTLLGVFSYYNGL